MKKIKRPKAGTKTHNAWIYVKEHKGEEYADRLYTNTARYGYSRRETRGYTRADMEKYRPDKSEFTAILEHLYKGHRNPYDSHRCAWCAEKVEWKDQNSTASKDNFIYCPSSVVGAIGKSSKCNVDAYGSRSKNFALSTIEVVWKIIEQDYKCAGKCKSYHFPYAYCQDHWVSRHKGGTDCNSNIKMLCATCNNSKGTKDGDEWLQSDGGWDCMVNYSEEVAILNLVLYCRHLKLKKRCIGLLNGDIVPHKDEMKYAAQLLAWILKHEDK